MKNWTSLSPERVVGRYWFRTLYYLPRRRGKKKAIPGEVAVSNISLGWFPWAEVSKAWMTFMGRGKHSCEGRILPSDRTPSRASQPKKSILPMQLWQGGHWTPTDAKI